LPALPVHKAVLDVASKTLDAYTVKGSDITGGDFDKRFGELIKTHLPENVKPSIDDLLAMLMAMRATFPRESGDEGSDSESASD
jgi:hypothetical protein